MPIVFTYPRLQDRYIELVRACNGARTIEAHRCAGEYARAWLDGVAFALNLDDADVGRIIMAADNHYIEQGIERPMCGGIWLDWTQAQKGTP